MEDWKIDLYVPSLNMVKLKTKLHVQRHSFSAIYKIINTSPLVNYRQNQTQTKYFLMLYICAL